jgi:WD40 repeat protein
LIQLPLDTEVAVSHPNVRAALLVFLCLLSCAISAQAQGDSSTKLSMVEIRPESAPGVYLEGAALSPDGRQVAAAFRRVSRTTIAVSVRIWNVGTNEPIASKELSSSESTPRESFNGARGFVQYCDNGSGVMVAARGTLYYLNPQTLEVLHATATNTGDSAIPERVSCAAKSPRAVVAGYAGAYCCLVRVYDLTSGTLLREWNLTKGPYPFGDVAISPSGNQIAVSLVPENSLGRSKAVENLELFDVNTGKVNLKVKTGHLPGRISFAGETRVATDDTLEPQPLLPHPEIKLWDLSNGKLLRTFGDPKAGARRFVGTSSDGNVILGYIPKETLRSGGDIEGGAWNQTLEQRFRLWDAATGETIATSPPLLPIESSTLEGFDPSLQVSGNGRAVIVFWKSPREILPLYVFSMAQPAPSQAH